MSAISHRGFTYLRVNLALLLLLLLMQAFEWTYLNPRSVTHSCITKSGFSSKAFKLVLPIETKKITLSPTTVKYIIARKHTRHFSHVPMHTV